jgi:hypothetical protein
VHDDWVMAAINDAPSPEAYVIDRGMARRKCTFPKAKDPKTRKKERVGPGSYETEIGLIKKSYNAGVPKAASALG